MATRGETREQRVRRWSNMKSEKNKLDQQLAMMEDMEREYQQKVTARKAKAAQNIDNNADDFDDFQNFDDIDLDQPLEAQQYYQMLINKDGLPDDMEIPDDVQEVEVQHSPTKAKGFLDPEYQANVAKVVKELTTQQIADEAAQSRLKEAQQVKKDVNSEEDNLLAKTANLIRSKLKIATPKIVNTFIRKFDNPQVPHFKMPNTKVPPPKVLPPLLQTPKTRSNADNVHDGGARTVPNAKQQAGMHQKIPQTVGSDAFTREQQSTPIIEDYIGTPVSTKPDKRQNNNEVNLLQFINKSNLQMHEVHVLMADFQMIDRESYQLPENWPMIAGAHLITQQEIQQYAHLFCEGRKIEADRKADEYSKKLSGDETLHNNTINLETDSKEFHSLNSKSDSDAAMEAEQNRLREAQTEYERRQARQQEIEQQNADYERRRAAKIALDKQQMEYLQKQEADRQAKEAHRQQYMRELATNQLIQNAEMARAIRVANERAAKVASEQATVQANNNQPLPAQLPKPMIPAKIPIPVSTTPLTAEKVLNNTAKEPVTKPLYPGNKQDDTTRVHGRDAPEEVVDTPKSGISQASCGRWSYTPLKPPPIWLADFQQIRIDTKNLPVAKGSRNSTSFNATGAHNFKTT